MLHLGWCTLTSGMCIRWTLTSGRCLGWWALSSGRYLGWWTLTSERCLGWWTLTSRWYFWRWPISSGWYLWGRVLTCCGHPLNTNTWRVVLGTTQWYWPRYLLPWAIWNAFCSFWGVFVSTGLWATPEADQWCMTIGMPCFLGPVFPLLYESVAVPIIGVVCF